MKRLPEAVKRRIIEHLACYCRPSEVVDLIESEYDITLTLRHIRAYDPASFQCVLSVEHTSLFWMVRKHFDMATSCIAIANRVYRLRQLDKLFGDAMTKGRSAAAARYLEQAAKETGAYYQRERTVRIK